MWSKRKYWSKRKFNRAMCLINKIVNDLTRKV